MKKPLPFVPTVDRFKFISGLRYFLWLEILQFPLHLFLYYQIWKIWQGREASVEFLNTLSSASRALIYFYLTEIVFLIILWLLYKRTLVFSFPLLLATLRVLSILFLSSAYPESFYPFLLVFDLALILQFHRLSGVNSYNRAD